MQIYYVGLLAGSNDFDAVEKQGPRGINRQVQGHLHSLFWTCSGRFHHFQAAAPVACLLQAA